MAWVLRLYIQMVLSYGLYVCIIMETAQHRTTLRIFCNITQKTAPKENGHSMLYISSPVELFIMGKSRTVLVMVGMKFHFGMAKAWGKRGYKGKGPK